MAPDITEGALLGTDIEVQPLLLKPLIDEQVNKLIKTMAVTTRRMAQDAAEKAEQEHEASDTSAATSSNLLEVADQQDHTDLQTLFVWPDDLFPENRVKVHQI